jgi:hypothetical protein
MKAKIQELMTYTEKYKIDSHEQLQLFKTKYSDYKQKLKKANASIQTLSSRIAKYEL